MSGRKRWVWAMLVSLLALLLVMPHVGAESRLASNKEKEQPVYVEGLGGVRSVAVGMRDYVALGSGGGVWAGSIAIDEPGVHLTRPVSVETGFAATAVASGWRHFGVLASNGTVWVGRFGISEPGVQRLTEMPLATAISAGPDYLAALTGGGQVYIADFGASRAPAMVEGLDKVVAISAGAGYLLAIRADGTAWHASTQRDGTGKTASARILKSVQGVTGGAAGDGYYILRRANGTIFGITVNEEGVNIAPPDGTDLTGVSAVYANGDHFLVVKSNGISWWGHCNAWTRRTVGAGQVTEIVARAAATGAYADMAVTADGKVYAWRAPTAAAQLEGWEQVRSIAAGDGILLGVKADGKALVAQFGIDEQGVKTYSVQSPRDHATGMASGRRIALLATDGTVWAGQVPEKGEAPIAVSQVPDLTEAKEIALHGDYLFALGADGLVRYTNLGGGSGGGKTKRTHVVPHILEVSRIAAGPAGLIAQLGDGSVWVARITADGPQEPVRVEGVSHAKAIVAGTDFLVATDEGLLWGIAIDEPGVHVWGDPHVDSKVWGDPHVMAVWGDPHVDSLSAGGGQFLGRDASGVVWRMKVIDEKGVRRLNANGIGGLPGVLAVAAGSTHHAALRADGTVWVWPVE